jgi:NAD(P)-dependent dehydrogenase (short-subunit alcohol dehydrogenase family)
MAFNGQAAIVTGVGNRRGIGYAVAKEFAQKGVNLLLGDVNLSGTEDICKELKETTGVKVIAVRLDVSDPKNVTEAVATTINHFGRIDILVNNAGISQSKSVYDITKDDFDRMMSINVTGQFLMMQAALRIMREQKYGRIISLSSVSAKNGGGLFGGCHYCAAKAALLGLSKSIAKQVAIDKITVNCVSPGTIDTDIAIAATPEQKQFMRDSTSVKRYGTTKEVADTIIFLASEEASFITGEDININGGSYMD